MKKFFGLLLVFMFFNSVFANGKMENSFENVIINADEVNYNEAILVDARGKTESTIRGAVVTSWTELATCSDGKPGDANWGVILDKKRLDKKLGELGLDMNKPIILFGDAGNGWGEEGRIAWQLIAVGYKNVKFVDGGYTALIESGLQTATVGSLLQTVKVDTKPINPAYCITTEELKEKYVNFKIVDARSKEEYDGATLHGEAKGGRLPDSILIEFKSLFKENGFLKSKTELNKMFYKAGLRKTDKIVTYCTGGVRAAYMQLILKLLGYNATNYDESFYRWCNIYEVEMSSTSYNKD